MATGTLRETLREARVRNRRATLRYRSLSPGTSVRTGIHPAIVGAQSCSSKLIGVTYALGA